MILSTKTPCSKGYKEKLSVRETEDLVKKKKVKENIDLPEIRSLEEKLQKQLGTKVKIQPKSPNKGKITIEYKSIEELENIIKLFLE
jgi:hypothetical protein